jgi:hypothetical protein
MRCAPIDPKQLERVRDDFALLFYRWARADAEKQAAHGFPLFSFLRDSSATKYLRVYNALSTVKKSVFLRAMLKRTHDRAVGITGEFMTPEEQLVVNEFISPPWENDSKELQAGWNRPRLSPHDRKQLEKLLKKQVEAKTGGDYEIWSPGLFVFFRIAEPWRISTKVFIKSKQNLGYEHSIFLKHDPEIRLKEYTSITRWLGIGETNWNLMTPDELEECAEAPLMLANYFLDAIPELLAKIIL